MNFWTFVVSAAIIGIMLIAVINYFYLKHSAKNNKKGGCANCPMAGDCNRKNSGSGCR